MSLLPVLLAALAAGVAVTGPGEAGRLTAALGPTPQGSRRWTPSRLPIRVVGGAAVGGPAVAGAAGLVLSGPALAVVAAAVTGVLAAALRRRSRTLALRAERRGASEACAVLAAELRAGRAPGQALEAAAAVAHGPFRERLLAGAATARFGGDTAAALGTPTLGTPTLGTPTLGTPTLGTPAAGAETGVPEAVAGLAACWSVCSGTGSGLAAAVERLEQGLRTAAEARRAVEAELAGPRATAGLLAVLPLAGIGLAAGLGARPGHVLLETTVGGVCLVLGVALDLVGLAWSRRIAQQAGAD